MASDVADQARRALLTLADLSASTAADEHAMAGSIPLEWFRWLPARGARMMSVAHPADPSLEVLPAINVERSFGERLAAVQQIRTGESSLRVGWLFVAGRAKGPDGKSRRVFQPLASRAVRVWVPPLIGSATLQPVADVEVNPLIADPDTRHELERIIEYGGGVLDTIDGETIPVDLLARLVHLRSWSWKAARGAGFEPVELIPADRSPDQLLRSKQLFVVAGCAVYAATAVGGLGQAPSLRGWAETPLDVTTAFHALYAGDADVGTEPAEPDLDRSMIALTPVSPFPLTPAQRRCVVRSRTAPITVISGAPGTGKSHTITALALDELGRGKTVLIAAKSEASVDALTELFERAPGPQPIVFGSSERKDALAAKLAGGQIAALDDGAVDDAREALAIAVSARDREYRDIAACLRAELVAAGDDDELRSARATWPVLFDGQLDLEELGALIDLASHRGGGWFAHHRRARAAEELDDLTGASTDAQRRDVVRAYKLARATESARSLVGSGGLEIGERWTQLAAIDDQVREAAATWLAAEARRSSRLTTRTLASVAALATALRSGRAARREQLSRIDDRLTRALPLWVGTLGDIEDLLPRRPALFDLVVLDEASSIDQPLAAAALLRAKRGVIVGDPRQLRQVSFLGDEQRAKAFATNGVDPSSDLALKLDVRRNSAFDVAAGVAPVQTLDEHFRGAPHLVDFVARHLYGGTVHVATRSPATELTDCVDVVRVAGTRTKDGVVQEEVAAVINQLRRLGAQGAKSVGVITPFRAQADAIEAAVLDAFDADALKALGLRVGTVHAFQGNEREIVIASMGVGSEGSSGAWRFAQESHLFTVLVTRARSRFIVIVSGEPPPRGLFARYLAQADAPPGRPAPAGELPPWPAGIASDLAAAGAVVLGAYPTGRHVVDVCVGAGTPFYGLECRVHPDGADAHIERHLSLQRAGWDLREAFASRWADRRGELVVELSASPGSEPVSGMVAGATIPDTGSV